MEGSAFLFMILSWSLILGLNIFCFTLLLTRKEQEVHTSAGGDTGYDREEEIT